MRIVVRWLRVLSLIFLATVSGFAVADEIDQAMQCIGTEASIKGLNALPYMFHYKDSDTQIAAPALDRGFELQTSFAGIGFNRLDEPGSEAVLGENNLNHWLRFCLRNQTGDAQNLVLALTPAVMAEIDFYPQKLGLPSFKTGNTKKMNTRDIHSPDFHFNISLDAGEEQHFYIRLRARTNAYMGAKLWNRANYEVAKDWQESKIGVFVGVLIGLILYNILLFVSVRQSSSLLYIAWSISVFLLLSSIDGRVLQYLTPNHPEVGRYITIIFYPVSVLLSALFGRRFMKLRDYPKLYKIGNWILFGGLITLAMAYLNGIDKYFMFCAVFALVVVMYFGTLCPLISYIKHRSVSAKYVLITQIPLILCVVDLALFALGVTHEFYVPYTPKTGLVMAMIIISYYVGFTTHNEKDEAQRLALEQLEISNNLKSSYNTELELEIDSKTADIRSMNSDLAKQAKQMVNLDEAKSKFFANISHEFRTPLTLIQGPLTSLLERNDFTEKETIQAVLRNSKALQHLIDQLLELSELDEGSLSLRTAKINVAETVQAFSAQFSSLAEQKGIEYNYTQAPTLIEAYIDPEKLQIIINNLVSNALKFTEHSGQVNVIVSTTLKQEYASEEFSRDEYVEITVSDTGLGIPANELAHIFDRYFQSSSTEFAKAGIGTGIGLALVKELVVLHGGEITVKSTDHSAKSSPNEKTGSIFRVRLPLGRSHLTETEIVSDSPSKLIPALADEHDAKYDVERNDSGLPAASNIEDHQTKVLVVDDNQDMRNYISELLSSKYSVVTANDGLQGEEALKQQKPDLIITDLMMPNRDGLQFVKVIKEDQELNNIPIIMLTARAGVDDRISGLLAAVDDYLVKPFNARELKARISNLLVKQAQFNAFYDDKLAASDSIAFSPNSLAQKTYTQRLQKIVEDRLLDSNFGVNELAEAMHVSTATLRRRLAEKTKFTPAAFIRHCRLEKARQLAAQGNMRSVTELANAVGFSQPTYFARLYQKTFNTPVNIK